MGHPIFKRFLTKERAEIYVKGMRTTARRYEVACEAFKSVACSHAGKVYNKRFLEEVNKVLLDVFGFKVYNQGTADEFKRSAVTCYESSSYCDDKRFVFKLTDTEVNIPIEGHDKRYETADEFRFEISLGLGTCFDGKRIIASAFVERVYWALDRVHATLKAYEDAVENWDVYMSNMRAIDEQLKELAKNINPLFLRQGAETLISGESLSYINYKNRK